jgi:ABC-type antimicrobial peptide transport system permease subunit
VTIVGVNPEYFTGIEPGANFEIWAPLNLAPAVSGHPWLDDPKQWQIPMMGRLKPGASDERAGSEMDALFQAAVDANPGPIEAMLRDPAKRPRFILQSAARGVDYLAQRYNRMLVAVFALAGLVLLIACANVANLLLAKSAVRQREISLRLALGAGRWRIVRQLLTEGLLLASMAGVLGVIFGYWTRNSIPALLATPWRPSPFDTAFDPKVLLVSIGITFFTGVLFSLAPVWQSRRVEVNEALKDSGRGAASLSKLRIGHLLVVLQVALSVLLLAGAGLCVKTFTNLRGIPLGFRPQGILLFSLDPPRLRYPTDRVGALLTQVQERLSALPDVQSASFSRNNTGETFVGSLFFETMGIPILSGRVLNEHDSANSPPVAVVNQAFERRFFPGENPVGRTLKGSGDVTYQIVGVCANWHFERMRNVVGPAFYGAFTQAPRAGWISNARDSAIDFEVKLPGAKIASGGPGAPQEVVNRIRQAVRSVDPNLAIANVRTGMQQIEDGLSQERLMASLAVVFGALALILAMIGIYGVMAYAVARRTSEIGIRVALGARPEGVAWMVLRETLALAAAGVAIGVPAVIALSPILDHVLAPAWMNSFAYGTKPNDPLTIAIAVLLLAAVGAMAGYLPAHRASRVDPMTALRHE